MTTKLSRLKALVEAGERRKAIRLAASFPSLGAEEEPIKRAAACLTSPAIYEGMGYNIEDTVAAGLAAIKTKYGWSE